MKIQLHQMDGTVFGKHLSYASFGGMPFITAKLPLSRSHLPELSGEAGCLRLDFVAFALAGLGGGQDVFAGCFDFLHRVA